MNIVPIALIGVSLGWLCSPATAEPRIAWQETRPNFWIAVDQNWKGIRFSAVKFHLGYFKIGLVDVEAYRNKNLEKIRAISDNRKFSNDLLDSGIEVIFRTWPSQNEIVAITPAGWSASLRRVDQVGLLKIDGKQYAEFDDRDSLSAIICLHSPLQQFREYEYQVPVFFKSDNPRQKELATNCRDAVQAGPRILEDPINGDQRGINLAEKDTRAQLRVVFAVDNPGRNFLPTAKKENARNGYLIITTSQEHLYDVQEMLMSPSFYGSDSKPHWAVNMAGGGPTGIVIRGEGTAEVITRGNPSGVIGSAFVIMSRK